MAYLLIKKDFLLQHLLLFYILVLLLFKPPDVKSMKTVVLYNADMNAFCLFRLFARLEYP